MTKPYIRQRHIAAFNILGYAIILSDPRITTGTIGFVLQIYGRPFILFLALWSFCGVLYLLLRRSSPVAILIATFPILAYSLMGTWYFFAGENTPIAALILPLLSVGNILYFIKTRLEDMATGQSLDDTILPPIMRD